MSARTRILALTFILASTAFAASGRNLKIARDLEQADGTVDVIVQFNTHPTEAHHEKIRVLAAAFSGLSMASAEQSIG